MDRMALARWWSSMTKAWAMAHPMSIGRVGRGIVPFPCSVLFQYPCVSTFTEIGACIRGGPMSIEGGRGHGTRYTLNGGGYCP